MLEFLLKNNIPHFVAKYFITSYANTNMHDVEFQVFIYDKQVVKKTWYKEPFYPRTKYRKLKKSEIKFFKENLELYGITKNNLHGRIYHPKEIEFDYDYARNVKK